MPTQQNIVTTIYNRINFLVGGTVNGVFDTQAPQDTVLPYVVFTIVADTPKLTFNEDLIDMVLQINVYADQHSGVSIGRAINDTLFDGLHRDVRTVDSNNDIIFKNTIKGISTITPDNIVNIRSEYEIN